MSILVIAEHDNSSLNVATLNSVTAAQAIGSDIDILVVGASCQDVATQAAQVAGIGKVLVADNSAYANALAENVAPLIAEPIPASLGSCSGGKRWASDRHAADNVEAAKIRMTEDRRFVAYVLALQHT